MKIVNLETIIDMQSWCRTWPPNGFSRIRAKQKLLSKHKGAGKSSWSRIGSLKSFTLTILWNLAKLAKISPGIIARLHHIDQRQNVTPICETSQIYYLMGRRPMKDVFGQPFKGPIFPFGSLVEYHPVTAKDQSRIHQFGKKVLPGIFLGYALYAGGNLEG